MALAAKKEGIQALFVPAENAAEATLAHGPAVYGIRNVKELAISKINSKVVKKKMRKWMLLLL